eukprot:1409146-Pyramimonas_sp.AAC.1
MPTHIVVRGGGRGEPSGELAHEVYRNPRSGCESTTFSYTLYSFQTVNFDKVATRWNTVSISVQ